MMNVCLGVQNLQDRRVKMNIRQCSLRHSTLISLTTTFEEEYRGNNSVQNVILFKIKQLICVLILNVILFKINTHINCFGPHSYQNCAIFIVKHLIYIDSLNIYSKHLII